MLYLQVTTNVPLNRKQKVLIDEEAISKVLVIVPEEKPE